MAELKRVCVYCGSNTGRSERFAAAALELGELLARHGLGVVYGGASVGLMGLVADAALAAGGEVIGVIPDQLFEDEVGHDGLSQLHVVASMHERKALMSRLADGFIALPGGYGTIEEVVEAVTWSQLGIHDKPVGLLDVDGYFDDLVRFLDRAVVEGFVSPTNRALLLSDDDAQRLLDRMERQAVEGRADASRRPIAAPEP
jgi:uncharacterized protein (TIGR00730 family)